MRKFKVFLSPQKLNKAWSESLVLVYHNYKVKGILSVQSYQKSNSLAISPKLKMWDLGFSGIEMGLQFPI